MLSSSKRIIQLLLAILFAYCLTQPLVAVANAQTARQVELSGFTAMLANQGIAVEWRAMGDSTDWNFTLYRSQNCQFAEAVEVEAPMFSSINDETQIAHYSLTDTAEPVIGTCAYWLVATESDGQKQHFGPYEVQGRTAIYLPLALQ